MFVSQIGILKSKNNSHRVSAMNQKWLTSFFINSAYQIQKTSISGNKNKVIRYNQTQHYMGT